MFRRAQVLLPVSFVLAGSLAAQRTRFAPGEIEREKPLLLGIAGSMLPDGEVLGAFGDVDGDGDVDALVDGRMHLNDGTGVFRAWRNADVAGERRLAFLLADADAHLDLLTRTHLYRGDGDGRFEDASSSLPAGFAADAVALGDFDLDLDLDVVALELATYSTPARLQLLLNDGNGAFVDASAFLPPTPAYTRALAAGDLDGDLDLDLVIAANPGLAVWANRPSGFAEVPGAVPALAFTTSALALVSVDGDADLDLVIAGTDATGAPGASWLENDGSWSFGAVTPIENQGKTAAIVVIDCESDGDRDLVLVQEYMLYGVSPYTLPDSAFNELRVNDGSGSFDTGVLPGDRGTYRAGFAADVDGDGDVDLAFEDAEYSDRLYLNDGHGSFGASSAATTPAGEWSVALGDLDGDGLLDAFTPGGVSRNGPPGVLTRLPAPMPPLETACYWAPDPVDVAGHSALGDVDGDGDLDAYIVGRGMGVCSGPYLQSNRLWLNDGSGRFSDETRLRLPQDSFAEVDGEPRMVALLELDGDGDLDAVCMRVPDYDFSGISSCYVNDGTGVFARKEQLGARSHTGAFGDLDGDGDADFLAGAYSYYSQNRVHLNDGTAHFVQSPVALPDHDLPLDANASGLADIDGDGDLDVYVSVGGGYRTSFVYVNDGTARFADEPWRIPASVPGYRHALAFVDVDLDGDADLASAGALFVNDGTGAFDTDPGRAETFAFGDSRMSVGDIDLDGDPDLVLIEPNAIAVSFARHLESLGPARVGKLQAFVVHGSPRTPYTLLESLGTVRVPLGASGWLLVDPARVVLTANGFTDGRGEAVVSRPIPALPALVGHVSYLQAFVGTPAHATNLVVSEIGGL
jgi:hypothetical protein